MSPRELPTRPIASMPRLLCLVILFSLVLSACAPSPAQEEPTPTPLPTPIIPTKPTYTVQVGDVERMLEFTGRIVPVVQADLFFKTSGRVDNVYVKKGDQVTGGQLLADLESGTGAMDLRRAEIYLEMARLNQQLAEIQTPRYLKEYDILMSRYRYEVELAQIAVDEIKAQVEATQIVAPFDGTVLSVFLSESTAVEGYKAVIILADLSALEISADLTETDLQELTEGLPVQIRRVSGPGDQVEGELRRLPFPYGRATREISETGAEDRSTRITPNADLAEMDLELGDLVRVVVVLEKKEGVVWLPPQAIRNFEGRRFVVVQDGEGQRRVDVNVGILGDERVEIEEGVSEGQVVVAP